jgi:hypothetical protein
LTGEKERSVKPKERKEIPKRPDQWQSYRLRADKNAKNGYW